MGNVVQLRTKAPSKRGKGGLSPRMVEILEAAEEYEIHSGRPLPNYWKQTTEALRRRGLLAFADPARWDHPDLRGWVLTPAGRAALRAARVS